jgi:two-component system, chemotaxis family, protein-glutamate methylesterase/glutaminase
MGGSSKRRARAEKADNPRVSPFAIVAVAASAGGLHAIGTVLAGLRAEFAAPLLVVQHLDRRHRSLMAEILGRRTALAVKEAAHGEHVRSGIAYVAPPDHHLLIEPDGTLLLTRTKLVHFVRPSADLLLESVAGSFGERAIGVVLSGTGRDGALGAEALRKTGGTMIVQDEASAEHTGMPHAARPYADFVLPLEEIAPALERLVAARAAA